MVGAGCRVPEVVVITQLQVLADVVTRVSSPNG